MAARRLSKSDGVKSAPTDSNVTKLHDMYTLHDHSNDVATPTEQRRVSLDRRPGNLAQSCDCRGLSGAAHHRTVGGSHIQQQRRRRARGQARLHRRTSHQRRVSARAPPRLSEGQRCALCSRSPAGGRPTCDGQGPIAAECTVKRGERASHGIRTVPSRTHTVLSAHVIMPR
jgi:hypothetical protein